MTGARPNPDYDDIERDLLGALGEAVIATDLHGAIIFWNSAAEDLYGWASVDVLGRGIFDVTPTPLSRDEAAAILTDLLNGKTWSDEFETRHKDGRHLRVEVTDYPVRDRHGQLVAIVGVSRPTKAPAQHATRIGTGPIVPAVVERVIARQTPAREWLIMIGLYLGAVCLRFLCDLLIPGALPFFTFLPAVGVGALFLRPLTSIVLLALSAATGLAWIRFYGIDDPVVSVTAPLLFLAFGGALVAVLSYGAALHRKLAEREERLALLNGSAPLVATLGRVLDQVTLLVHTPSWPSRGRFILLVFRIRPRHSLALQSSLAAPFVLSQALCANGLATARTCRTHT